MDYPKTNTLPGWYGDWNGATARHLILRGPVVDTAAERRLGHDPPDRDERQGRHAIRPRGRGIAPESARDCPSSAPRSRGV